jgi:hypothetical protein
MERGLMGSAVAAAVVKDAGGVRQRAGRLAGRYEELVADADAAAVRWRWATPSSGHGDIEPLRLERMGCSPGQWLHRPPPPWHEHEAIGFDALGRVVCVREYDATGEVWLERFVRWSRTTAEIARAAAEIAPSPMTAEIACFRAPVECDERTLAAELQAVTLVRFAAGRPAESERYLPPTGSCTRARYWHEGGRLARVEEDSCDDRGGLATIVKEVVYGEDGRVAGIDRLGPDGRHAVWRAPLVRAARRRRRAGAP